MAASLDPDGLGVANIGESEGAAESALVGVLGPSTGTASGTCSETTEVEWNDLSVEFSDGVFTGYRYNQGGFVDLGKLGRPISGPGTPPLQTATGAALGMTLAKVRSLYPPSAFSAEQGGAIVVSGSSPGNRLFLGFFSTAPSTPMSEVKGGSPCGDI